MRGLFIFALGLAVFAGQANAGSLSCPAPGVVAEMSDGSKFVFEGSDSKNPGICLWRTIKDGNIHQSQFIFSVHGIDNEAIDSGQMQQMLEAVFDPSSHGVVSAVLSNEKWNSSLRTIITTSQGTVTVEAGTFPSIVIKVESTGVFGNTNKNTSTYHLDQNTHVPVLIEEIRDGRSFELHAMKLTVPKR